MSDEIKGYTVPQADWEVIDLEKRIVQRMGGRTYSSGHRDRYYRAPVGPGSEDVRMDLCTCGEQTVVDLPYPSDGPHSDHGESRVRLCLVCDGAHRIPRIQKELSA